MNKAHSNINWENLPSTNTPLNQQNLNQMDNAIDVIDNRVIVHDNEITQLQGYETRAAQSATAAANSASTASTKATAAATSATNSENFYKYSKSYAVGGTGIRSGEDTDNSKYYYEQVKSMASGGHAIMDSNGTAMAGRSILQFANSRVKDDATNDKTIIAPAHGHTNLLNPTLGTTTINGVACTANGDGTYTLNGTASADILFPLQTAIDTLDLPKTYRLVGCPSSGSASTFELNAIKIVGSTRTILTTDRGQGTTHEYPSGAKYEVRIRIGNGAVIENATFKPMLTTDLSATYDDYVQYSGNGELNQNVAALYKGLESTDANLADVQSQIVTSGNIESGNTATSAHTVGTYIQWKGKFYVVTAAIAVGDTLAVGTNLAAKTVGEVLTQINADLTDNKNWKSYGTAGITQVAELMKAVANRITIPKTASELVIIGNQWSTTVPLITRIYRDISFYYSDNYLCNGFVSIDAQYIGDVNKAIDFSTCVTKIGANDIITGRGKITGIYYR